MGKGDKRKKEKKEKEAEASRPLAMDEDEPSSSGLPEHLELQRTRVICGPEMNSHVSCVRGSEAS